MDVHLLNALLVEANKILKISISSIRSVKYKKKAG